MYMLLVLVLFMRYTSQYNHKFIVIHYKLRTKEIAIKFIQFKQIKINVLNTLAILFYKMYIIFNTLVLLH